ncbi:hypothetical protein [Pseudomonas sp. GM_Psu_2]|uniref:hypothetical protein n=1 Tax=unclassified Pseudomonas TaxID=196821 RepID=UPI00226A639F|nr:hypothetical protein [Pseudomonas sp. GM_Psu_2]
MNQPLTSATSQAKRKELVRLRMEMYRQQLIYNAQPLHNPISLIGDLVRPNRDKVASSAKKPLMLGATVFLSLFGKRLGAVGRLARIGLALYPIVNRFQAHHREQRQAEHPLPPPR